MPSNHDATELLERLNMHDAMLRGGPDTPGVISDLRAISASVERLAKMIDRMEQERRDAQRGMLVMGFGVIGSLIAALWAMVTGGK